MGKKPIFVHPLRDDERSALEAGLRSSDAFVLRRCQILLSSARGKRASQIAVELGCDADTALKAIKAFNTVGLAALVKGSCRPHTIHAAFHGESVERLQALLHESPREFGKSTSVWTLDLLADVSFEQGLTAEQVTGETVRATLERLGICWRRAKRWITSPDPQYGQKKALETA